MASAYFLSVMTFERESTARLTVTGTANYPFVASSSNLGQILAQRLHRDATLFMIGE
jgi:hypothetical protein